MADSPRGPARAVSLVFDDDVWAQEVGRYPDR